MTLVAKRVEHAVDRARDHFVRLNRFLVDKACFDQVPDLPEVIELSADRRCFSTDTRSIWSATDIADTRAERQRTTH